MKAYKVLTEENTQKIINEREREGGGLVDGYINGQMNEWKY